MGNSVININEMAINYFPKCKNQRRVLFLNETLPYIYTYQGRKSNGSIRSTDRQTDRRTDAIPSALSPCFAKASAVDKYILSIDKDPRQMQCGKNPPQQLCRTPGDKGAASPKLGGHEF